jgi:hypothetical protein
MRQVAAHTIDTELCSDTHDEQQVFESKEQEHRGTAKSLKAQWQHQLLESCSGSPLAHRCRNNCRNLGQSHVATELPESVLEGQFSISALSPNHRHRQNPGHWHTKYPAYYCGAKCGPDCCGAMTDYQRANCLRARWSARHRSGAVHNARPQKCCEGETRGSKLSL